MTSLTDYNGRPSRARQRARTACGFLALYAVILSTACRSGPEPMVVRVFYDEAGPVGHLLSSPGFRLTRTPLRTASGKPIIVADVLLNTEEYRERLATEYPKKFQLVIF